ncbi:MAG: DnaD domain protein [Mycoplasmataceae bacterium]|nr:DnaD domain protein [Mycoplasmataceae bacterium]
MLQNLRFFVNKDYQFSIGSKISNLYDFYAPIVGNEAISLYIQLFNESDKQSKTLGSSTQFIDFFKMFQLNNDKFNEIRAKLEAIGLLTTYVLQNKEQIYVFVIHEPLNFVNFVNNQKFKHLLISCVGQNNFEKLEYCYSSFRVNSEAVNVSSTFEQVFTDKTINEVISNNYKELYNQLSKELKSPLLINSEARNTIESYFKSYDLSINEVKRIIFVSMTLTDDRVYNIDEKLLKINLDKLINSVNNINVLSNIKINRNNSMWLKYVNSNDLKNVFSDYNTLNSEQYLRAIMKQSLSNEEIDTLNRIREQYLLSDSIINMLIDLTIYKTSGKFNCKYLNKVSQTINSLNLNTHQQIYDYLLYHNDFQQSSVQQKNQTNEQLVEWSS